MATHLGLPTQSTLSRCLWASAAEGQRPCLDSPPWPFPVLLTQAAPGLSPPSPLRPAAGRLQ